MMPFKIMLLNLKLCGQVLPKKKLIKNYSVPPMNELSTLALVNKTDSLVLAMSLLIF